MRCRRLFVRGIALLDMLLEWYVRLRCVLRHKKMRDITHTILFGQKYQVRLVISEGLVRCTIDLLAVSVHETQNTFMKSSDQESAA